MFVNISGKGPDLVLIHGWGLNGAVWQGVLPELEQHFRVHNIDLPGFGESKDVWPDSLRLVDWALMIREKIPNQSIVVGWSLGGLFAQQLAIEFPDKVRHLVLVGSTPKFCQGENWPGMKPEVLQSFHQALQRDPAKTIERFLAIQAMGSESVKDDVRRLKQWLQDKPVANAQALNIGLDILGFGDLRSQWHRIQCPITGLFGRLDSLVPIAAIEQMTKLCPTMDTFIFPHSSHAPFISEPSLFMEQLYKTLHLCEQ